MSVVVAGNKADRLPIVINQETPAAAERMEVGYVLPGDQDQAGLLPPAPKEAAIPPRPDIIPRHWHDPHALKGQSRKQKGQHHQAIKQGRRRQSAKAD
jgi:hypothetical protein